MARADDPKNLLSYFDFKEKLEKKIKKKKEEKKSEHFSYDWEDKDEEQDLPVWAREDFDDDKTVIEGTLNDVESDKEIEVDPELAKLFDGKEKENKRLQDKHKEDLVKELEGEDI